MSRLQVGKEYFRKLTDVQGDITTNCGFVTYVEAMLDECASLGVQVHYLHEAEVIEKVDNSYAVYFSNGAVGSGALRHSSTSLSDGNYNIIQ